MQRMRKNSKMGILTGVESGVERFVRLYDFIRRNTGAST